MTLGLNRGTFIGHLGRTPEMRYTPKAQLVYVEGRAKNRRWTDASDIVCSCAELVAHDAIALEQP